jgi:hypothetical protein
MNALRACLVLIGLLAIGGTTKDGSARAAPATSPHTPRDWLAFAHLAGGGLSFRGAVRSEAGPQIRVFQDGRVVWLEAAVRYGQDGRCDPDLWREGAVAASRLAAFKAMVGRNRFFTVQPEPDRPYRERIECVGMQEMGVAFDGWARTALVNALDAFSPQPVADPFTRTVAVLYNAIWALTPRVSHRCQPEAIRVAFLTTSEGGGTSWPLPEPPIQPPSTAYAYYAGADARLAIDALARTNLIRMQEQTFRAVWSPDFEMPWLPDPVPSKVR